MRSEGLAMRIGADSSVIPDSIDATWGTRIEEVRR
jgi:hypothetical protein